MNLIDYCFPNLPLIGLHHCRRSLITEDGGIAWRIMLIQMSLEIVFRSDRSSRIDELYALLYRLILFSSGYAVRCTLGLRKSTIGFPWKTYVVYMEGYVIP